MAKAHTKEKFYEVDYTYPLLLARNSLARNAKQYLLVSALGADKQSSIYYNQVKGKIEEAIGALGFETVHFFRPSLLLGPRAEHRSAEDAAKIFYRIFGFLIPAKYKAIESEKVARAMLHFASQDQKGNFIHESKDLQKFYTLKETMLAQSVLYKKLLLLTKSYIITTQTLFLTAMLSYPTTII